MNFEEELNHLLKQEVQPIGDHLRELATIHNKLLRDTEQKTNDISLQVEEIYDIIKENDEAEQAATAAKKRENTLLSGLVALSDIIDHFIQFARSVPGLSEPAETIRRQRDDCLNACSFRIVGKEGEPLNPRFHVVKQAVASSVPFEHIAQVMQNGYEYNGKIIRKAAVAVSKGVEDNASDSRY